MLPLRDINQTRRVPGVTYLLIGVNLAVFVYQFLVLSPDANRLFVATHAVVPNYLLSGYGPALSTPLSSMFMHGGLAHLAMNMWFLHVFGDNVEDALGHGRYLIFYLVTGVVASLAHALIDPSSHVPLVGASGAISGVLGAYVLLYPRARVLAWIILVVELPAAVFLLLWFAMQAVSAFHSLGTSESTGVAFFAHVGGFIAGVLLMLAGGRPKEPVTYLGPRVPTRQMKRRVPDFADD